jgi:uncharacterized protein YfaS (alpha-2-macroglobulin family)
MVLIIGGGAAFGYVYKKHSTTSKVDLVQGESHFDAIPEPFRVVSTTPTDAAINVSPKTTVTITFSRAVDPEKTKGDFFFTPTIEGTYTKGKDDTQIVFTPKFPLEQAQKVSLMIHGEFTSNDGAQLGGDFFTEFSTNLASNQVVFENGNYYSDLTNVQSKTKQTYSLLVGDGIDASAEVALYKSDMTTLLDSLRYRKNAQGFDEVFSSSVNTAALTAITTKKGIKNGDTIDVEQDKGVYVLVATSKGQEVGTSWVVYNDKGLLVRQDDQKVVLLGESLTESKVLSGDVTLYNLESTVKSVGKTTIDGVTELTVPYESRVDVVVATLDGDMVIAPLHIGGSLSDNRVNKNLSNTKRIFGTTDRPVYKSGDTIKIAGFARVDNDAQYTVLKDKTITLYVGDSPYATPLTSVVAKVDATSGLFTAELPVTDKIIGNDDTNLQRVVYTADGGNNADKITVASFTATKKAAQTGNLTAHFEKTQYTGNDTIKMTFEGTDASGKPLANTPIAVSEYTKEYREGDDNFNEQQADYVGWWLNDKEQKAQTLTLDANGKLVITIPVSSLTANISQVVTVQGEITATSLSAGTSAVIHQGSKYLTFATSKSVFSPSEELIGRVTVYDLENKVSPNTDVSFEFVQDAYNTQTNKTDTKTILTGTAKTDSNGNAEFKKHSDTLNPKNGLRLLAHVKDGLNNRITASKYLYVKEDNSMQVYSHLQLDTLDISGTNGSAAVGDTQKLTITSPTDVTALITYERGRVLKQQVVTLKAGNNPFDLAITPDLAPSFTMAISYFRDGHYFDEGTTFAVAAPKQLLNVTITPDKASYVAKDTASFQIQTNDTTGTATSSHLIVGIVDDNVFSINDRLSSNIANVFYGDREITTNSSSSLVGLGSGGGGCGGGGVDVPRLINRLGATLAWNTTLTTDKDGKATLKLPVTAGSWRIFVYAASEQTAVGSASKTITVK